MNNIQKLQNAVKAKPYDALMLISGTNRLYATGFSSSAGIVFITPEKSYFMTDSRYIEAAGLAIGGAAEVLLVKAGHSYMDYINGFIAEYGVKTVGFEERALSYADYLDYSRKMNAELVPAQPTLDELRIVKTKEELDVMIEAQRIAEAAFEDVLGMIGPDKTEKDIEAEFLYRFAKHGADGYSFKPIVVSGEHSSMPHGVPQATYVQGFLTMDFGVRYKGYCSDMTRTVCIGQPTAEMEKVYYTVLEAQETAIAATKAGLTGRELDAVARGVIEKAGYGEYFGHSYGHGLGLDVHEMPNAAPSSEGILPAGAVVSAEPGIYLPGKFGVRIEDCVYITESGCINLMKTPKELLII